MNLPAPALLCAAALLSGCVTRTVQTGQTQPDENLLGFYSTKPQGRGDIYIIGDKRGYRLDENPALVEFMQSENAGRAVYTDVRIRIYPENGHEAFIRFRIYLDAQSSNAAALAHMKKYKNILISPAYQADAATLAAIRRQTPHRQAAQTVIAVDLAGRGEVVSLAGRDGLLSRQTLRTPLTARVSYQYRRKEVDMKQSLQRAALVPAAAVMIPLMAASCMHKSGFTETCLFY